MATEASENINIVSSLRSQPVVLSPLCGMVHGFLQSVEPAEGCVIGVFRDSKGEIVRVALPAGLDLPIGDRIGICRDEERYIVRRLS